MQRTFVGWGLNYVDQTARPYRHADNGKPWNGRSGCIGCHSDVTIVQDIASPTRPERTFIRLNAAATVVGIEAMLTQAIYGITAPHHINIVHSGHGAQLPDDDGDEHDRDPGDRMDEAQVLYDGYWRDDQALALIRRIPAGVTVFIVSDTCFSHGGFRQGPKLFGFGGRGENEDRDGVSAEVIHIAMSQPNTVSYGASTYRHMDCGRGTKAMAETWDDFTANRKLLDPHKLTGLTHATLLDAMQKRMRADPSYEWTPQLACMETMGPISDKFFNSVPFWGPAG